MNQAIYKVPEGKLLKIFLTPENDKITDIKITGDFFMYPEEAIVELEQALIGLDLNETLLADKLNQVIADKSLELFGVDAESIAKTILLAAN